MAAISWVGSLTWDVAEPTFVDGSVMPIPDFYGVTPGNILLWVFMAADVTLANASISGAGWTTLFSSTVGTGYMKVAWKIAEAGDVMGSWDVTHDGLVGQYPVCFIMEFAGQNASPIGAEADAQVTTTAMPNATLTTDQANQAVFYMAMNVHNFDQPSGNQPADYCKIPSVLLAPGAFLSEGLAGNETLELIPAPPPFVFLGVTDGEPVVSYHLGYDIVPTAGAIGDWFNDAADAVDATVKQVYMFAMRHAPDPSTGSLLMSI